jgi:hypothetical protein
VQQGQYLKKNMLYKNTDFDLVRRNIDESQRLVNKQMQSNYNVQMQSETPPDEMETPQHYIYDGRTAFDQTDGDTATEDMSMSMQKERQPPVSGKKGKMFNGMPPPPRVTNFKQDPRHSPEPSPVYSDREYYQKQPQNNPNIVRQREISGMQAVGHQAKQVYDNSHYRPPMVNIPHYDPHEFQGGFHHPISPHMPNPNQMPHH